MTPITAIDVMAKLPKDVLCVLVNTLTHKEVPTDFVNTTKANYPQYFNEFGGIITNVKKLAELTTSYGIAA